MDQPALGDFALHFGRHTGNTGETALSVRDCDRGSSVPLRASRWSHVAPVIALLLLSPIIGEVLFGATRITSSFVLLPQIGTWGCAALLIRESARRRHTGYRSMLILGMALAVAEECLIQQTSLAPLVGADVNHPYARWLGVNWVYFLWAVGYESVWIVVLPIQLTEIIFRSRREESWVGRRGLIIAAIAFVLSSFVAWYSWTQVYVPQFFPELAYRPPAIAIVVASIAIVALVIVAHSRAIEAWADFGPTQLTPTTWRIGVTALALGIPWFGLIFLAYGAVPALPAIIPILTGLAIVVSAVAVVDRSSRSSSWNDAARLALVGGALLSSMLAGFLIFAFGGAQIVDVVGKLVLNAAALAGVAWLARDVRSRNSAANS